MKLKLLEKTQRLPVQERIELVAAIWNTVAEDADANTLPLSATHRAELNRRVAYLKTTNGDIVHPKPRE